MADDGPDRLFCRHPRILTSPDHRSHLRGQVGADTRIHSGKMQIDTIEHTKEHLLEGGCYVSNLVTFSKGTKLQNP